MVIKLMDVTKWQLLEEGELIRFTKSNPRTVRIDVNTPNTVSIYIAQESDGLSGDSQFLAVVFGRDTLEFSVDGAFELTHVGGELWWYTIDGQNLAVEKVDTETFTRIVERRQRNPEMEYMMHMMQQNVERRIDALSKETELRFAQRLRERDRDGTVKDTGQAILGKDEGASDSGKADGKSGGNKEPPPEGASKDAAPTAETGTKKP